MVNIIIVPLAKDIKQTEPASRSSADVSRCMQVLACLSPYPVKVQQTSLPPARRGWITRYSSEIKY